MANKLFHKALTMFGVGLMVFGSTAGGASVLAEEVTSVVASQKQDDVDKVKDSSSYEKSADESAKSQKESGTTSSDNAKQGKEADANAPDATKMIDAKAEVAKVSDGVSSDTEKHANAIAKAAKSKAAKDAVSDVEKRAEGGVKSSFEDSKVIDDTNVVVVLPKEGTAKDVVEAQVAVDKQNLKSDDMKNLASSLENSSVSKLGLDQLAMEYLSINGLASIDWVAKANQLKKDVKFDTWSSDLQNLFLSGNAVASARYEFKGSDAKSLDSNSLRDLVRIYSGEYAKYMTDKERSSIYSSDGVSKFKDVKYIDLKHDAKLLGDMVDARSKGKSAKDVDKMALGLDTIRPEVKDKIKTEMESSKDSSNSGMISLFGSKVKAAGQTGWDGQYGSNMPGGAGGYTAQWNTQIYFGVSSNGAAFVLLPDGKYYPSFCVDYGDTGVNGATVHVDPLDAAGNVKGDISAMISPNPTLTKNVFDFFYYAVMSNGIPTGVSYTSDKGTLNSFGGVMESIENYWNSIEYQVTANNWNIWDDWVAAHPGAPALPGTDAWRKALNAKNAAGSTSNKNVTHTFDKPGDTWNTGIDAPTGVALNSGHSEYDLYNNGGKIWVRAKASTSGSTLTSTLNVTGGTNNGMKSVYLSAGMGQTRVAALSAYTNPYSIKVNIKVNGYVRLRLNKSNDDTSLTNKSNAEYNMQGAEYGVYSDSAATKKIASLTVGADNFTAYTPANLNLMTGTVVYVKETKAPKGFALNTKVYSQRLATTGNPDSTGNFFNTLNVSDTPQGINISIHKSDRVHGDSVPNDRYSLAGAVFEIKGVNGNTTAPLTVTTDAKGNAVTGKLALGKYEVREVKAPVGFTIDSAWRQTINITSDNPGTSTDVIIGKDQSKASLANNPVYGESRLEKQDADTGRYSQGMAHLDGAEYTLYDADTNKAVSLKDGVNGDNIKATAGKLTSSDSVVMTTTGSNDGDGYWVGVKGLYLGKYYWKETKAPTGYLIDSAQYAVDIQYKDQNTDRVRVGDVVSKDKVITGIVRGQKLKTANDTSGTNSNNSPLVGIRVLVTSKTTGKTYSAIKKADGSIEAIDVNTGNESNNPYNDSKFKDNNYTNLSEMKDVGGIKVAIYQIINLPYDDYVVSEDPSTLPEGLDLFKDTTVRIREKDQINDVNVNDDGGFISNDKRVERYISLRKIDAETGKAIPYEGATFKIYDTAKTWSDKQNKWVDVDGAKAGWVSQYDAKTNGYVSEWTSDKDGYIALSRKLDYGVKRYEIHEIKAPVNYSLHDPYVFSVDNPSTTNKEEDSIGITFPDPPAKGLVQLTKFFEGVDSVTTSDTDYGRQYHFNWDYNTFLTGAEFEVRASEDISPLNAPDILKNIPGGVDSQLYKDSIRYHKGDLITTLKPDGKTGIAKSDKILYVGKYELQEVKAPAGFTLNKDVVPFTIDYDGESYEAVNKALEARNARLETSIELDKKQQNIKDIDDEGNLSFTLDKAPNVVFGLYSADGVMNSTGQEVVPKDGLMDIFTTDASGHATTKGKYPDGTYYIKELKVSQPWILSDYKYSFNLKYADNNDQDIHIYANGYTVNGKYEVGQNPVSDDEAKAVSDFANGRNSNDSVDYQNEYNAAAKSAATTDGLNDFLNFRATPKIGTEAKWENGTKEVSNNGKHIVTDTVSYTNLIPGKQYQFKAKAIDQDTGKELINPDTKEAYSGVVGFTPTADNASKGFVDVNIEIDSSELASKTIVMFEDLYENNVRIAFHHDITDKGQSVRVIEMNTNLLGNVSSDLDISKKESISDLYKEVGKTANVASTENVPTRFVDLINFKGLGFVDTDTYDVEFNVMKRVYSGDHKSFTLEAVTNGDSVISGKTSFKPSDWVSDNGSSAEPKDKLNLSGFAPIAFTIDDLKAYAGSEIVVTSKLYHNGVLLSEHNTDGTDDKEAIYIPKIETTLTDNSNEHYVPVSKDITLVDHVKYDGLQPGKTYKVSGLLMDKDSNKPALDDEGNEIKSTSEFKADASSGVATVEFKYSGVNLAGQAVVAFETVSEDDVNLAVHADINDESQTVYHPSMGTTLTDDFGSKYIDPSGNVTLTDKIDYKNFKVGSKVRFDGKLMLRKKSDVKSDSVKVDNTTKEIDPNLTTLDSKDVPANGIIEVDHNSRSGITLDGNSGKLFVSSYDQIKLSDGSYALGIEVDFENNSGFDTSVKDVFNSNFNLSQTIDGKAVQLSDASNLVKDYKSDLIKAADTKVKSGESGKAVFVYKLAKAGLNVDFNHGGNNKAFSSISYNVVDDTTPTDNSSDEVVYAENGVAKDADGKEITGQTTMDITESNGSANVTFKFDASALAGYDVVAYESATVINADKEYEYSNHKDINDNGQTVHISDMGTTLTGVNNSKSVDPNDSITLTDEISYKNFEVGRDVKFSGVLMDKATNKAILDNNGKEIKAESVQTITSADGKAMVKFTFNGSNLAGKDLVAFEKAYDVKTEKLVGHHEDINDKGQTVNLTSMGTTLSGANNSKTVDPNTSMTLTDEISYKNFEVGRDVKFSGVLMDKATNKPILDNNGKEIKAESVQTIKTSDGKAFVKFTFNGSNLAGKDLVAFEKAYDVKTGTLVGHHEDINDKGQTVHINLKPRTPLAKFGDVAGSPIVWIGLGIALIGGVLIYKGRKHESE